jgi:hypothetical protein
LVRLQKDPLLALDVQKTGLGKNCLVETPTFQMLISQTLPFLGRRLKATIVSVI